jgi:hypothetical protein
VTPPDRDHARNLPVQGMFSFFATELADQGRFCRTQPHPSTKASMSEDQTHDVPPNHLSSDPGSPFYSEEVLLRGVGIRFNGVETTNVLEYDVAEGWVRIEVPTAKDRRGHPLTMKRSGTVEPYFRSAESP